MENEKEVKKKSNQQLRIKWNKTNLDNAFGQHVVSTYSMPSTVLSPGDTKMKNESLRPRVSRETEAQRKRIR